MQLSAIRSELGRWNETQIKQITKKSQQRVWHVNNRGEMNDAADGTRSEMRIWDRKRHDMRHTMNVEWKFTRLVDPVVFKIDYNEVPFLSGSFWKKQAKRNWKIPGWLFATKKRGAGWCWSLVSWVKTHGPESIEKEHEISQKHKTITARDKSSRTERANDILLLNAYGTDGKSGSWK